MSTYYQDDQTTLHHGDALDVLREMPDGSVDCIVTSPPYFGLRDYGHPGQYGLESDPKGYIDNLSGVFSEASRVLRKDGTFWLNVADVYGGGGIARPSGRWPSSHDPKDRTNGRRRSYEMEKCLLGVPDSLSATLVSDGWVLRNRIAWVKGRAVPSSARDRLNPQHEPIFLYVQRDGRRPNYYFDKKAYESAGDVWDIPVTKDEKQHYATFPTEVARRCIRYGCRPGGVVLDPFSGSGTTGVAALEQRCKYIGIELVEEYVEASKRRLTTRTEQIALI